MRILHLNSWSLLLLRDLDGIYRIMVADSNLEESCCYIFFVFQLGLLHSFGHPVPMPLEIETGLVCICEIWWGNFRFLRLWNLFNCACEFYLQHVPLMLVA
jgi:hypothetical protein